jgi:O-antigen/teichoic acid export membrane protein
MIAKTRGVIRALCRDPTPAGNASPGLSPPARAPNFGGLPNDPRHTPAQARDRALRLAVIASVLAKGFSMLCTVAQVPVALHYLGPESYGLWIALMSVYGLLNFVDFGLGVGMQQKMAEAFAQNDARRLRQTFHSGVAALALLGAAGLLAGLPLAWLGDWGRWFGVTDPVLRDQAPAALALIVLGFGLGLPGNAVVRLGGALQLGRWHAVWNATGNGLTLLVVWLITRADAGFLALVAASALLPTVQNLGLWWQLRRRLDWRGPGEGLLPRAEWRGFLRASFLFTFPQFSIAALNWLPPLVISLGAGAGAVTAFNLVQRLLGPFSQGQVILLTPLWPAYTEARLRGDWPWLRRAERRALGVSLALIAALGLACGLAEPLIRLWVGAAAVPLDPRLVWLTGLWSTLLIVGLHYIYFLVGLDRLRALAFHAALGGAAAVAGLLAGSFHGGAVEALALGCVGYAVFGLPGMIVASYRRPMTSSSSA